MASVGHKCRFLGGQQIRYNKKKQEIPELQMLCRVVDFKRGEFNNQEGKRENMRPQHCKCWTQMWILILEVVKR